MAKDTKYVQCKLQRGNSHQTSWIPALKAVEGKILSLKEGDEWSDGWKVILTGNCSLTEKYLMERSRDYLHTRVASDC